MMDPTSARAATLAVLLSLALAASAPARAQRAQPPREPTPSLAEPALSPDASEVAFVSGGDIWTAPASGGEARLLVSHAATESRPLYSPDGKRLAFISTRTGNGDIYVLTFATGELRRLTFDDGLDQLDNWSRDGRWLYFSSTSHDISGMNDIFRVSIDGGTPMAVSADRYANEYWAAPAPDGKALAFTARGITSSQWWRKGHSHLDESELWLMRESAGGVPSYERIGADSGGKEMWPMWTADGRALYFVSDRGGAQNIWMRPVGGAARPVTSFQDGRVLWPSISYDGRAIVFERDFRIWRLDVASGAAHEIPVTLRGAPAGLATEHLTLTSDLQELALSPDGKKVAFIVRGEVFAAPAKEGGDAARITTTPANETGVAWSPDSRRIVYVSDRDGPQHIYLYDFATRTESRLTNDARSDVSPRFSPDGTMLAFERDGRELRVLDLASKAERMLATGYLERAPFVSARGFTWSPDSRWIAYSSTSGKQFSNAYVVAASGGTSRPVSFLANVFGGSISWSPDGTYLLFDTRQRTEEGQIARVDLVPRTPRFREDQFRDLFRDESPRPTSPAMPARPTPARPEPRPSAPARDSLLAASPTSARPDSQARRPSKPVTIVYDDIRQRLSLLPVGLDVSSLTISPDGKWVLLVAAAAGQQNLYVYPLDELAREAPVARQLTSTAGAKRGVQWAADSKEVYYLDAGRINVLQLDTRQARPVAVSAEMDVDFGREKMEVFTQAWSYLRDNFFDANFNGVDWSAVREAYMPRIEGARTPDEMRRILSLMVGELNASHSGIGAPPGTAQPSTGRIGLRFDRAEYERAGKLKVIEVVPLSPAALAGNVKAGEYLLAVDGTRIDARTNLDQLLDRKINRRVVLTIAASADGAAAREVAVRPTNAATEKGLLYRAWVNAKRAYVAKVSNGRLGYVHMIDMSAGALSQLYLDLDAENQAREGVVIDVRNNNGGFVNAYALDVLSRRPYLTMTQRGLPSAPARTVLGQRALEAPTVLVTNQHSLSDAEDFTEGYRALKLGKVVGEPTAGWIIYTSGATLVDGSSVRIPFTRITASDGTPMEMHPRPVDVLVVRPIGESYTGRDSQLDAAVRELLKEIGTPAPKARAQP